MATPHAPRGTGPRKRGPKQPHLAARPKPRSHPHTAPEAPPTDAQGRSAPQARGFLEQLWSRPELVRGLLDESSFGVYIGRAGKTFYANRALVRMIGYERVEDIPARSALDLVAPEDRLRVERIRDARLRGEPVLDRYEFRALRRNGERFWVEISVTKGTWDGEDVFLATLADVTERHAAGAALRQSEERLRNLVQGSIEGILVFAEGKIIFANSSAARVYGFETPGEMLGIDPLTFVAPADLARVAAYREARTRGEPAPLRYEFQAIKRSGEPTWIEILVSPVEWDGRPAFLATLLDISERRAAAEALRQSEERFRTLVEGSIQGMLVVPAKRREIVFANTPMAQMMGYAAAQDLVGVDPLSFAAEEDYQRLLGYREARLRGEQTVSRYEFRGVRRDGKDMWIEWQITPIQWDGQDAYLVTQIDLTVRRQSEQAVRQSEERFRTLVQESTNAILVADDTIIFANPSAARMYGFDRPEDMIGVDPAACMAPEDRERIAGYRAARSRGEPAPSSYESQALKRSGERFSVATSISPVEWDGRRALLVAQADITESKRAELALRQSEERFRTLVQSSVQGIVVVREGKIIFANPAVARIGGFERPADLIGLDILTFTAPEHLARMSRLRAQQRRGEMTTVQFENESLRRDGTRVWLDIRMNPVQWDGQPAYLLTLEDVSHRKHAELALRESEERFRNLVEGSIQGIVIHRNLRLLFANAAMARTFGYGSVDELTRLESVQAMVAPHERERLKNYQLARMRGEPVSDAYEFQGLTREGRLIWIDCRARMVNWDGERATQLIVIDVTARKQAEQQREALLADLSRANEELRDVAHIVAHDLKAPLRGIGTLAEWLGEDAAGNLDAQAREHLDELRRRTHRMSAMLDGILAYSRLGHTSGTPEPLDSGQVLAEVLETLNPPPSIAVSVAPGLPVVVADRTRLMQIFQNLVGNAIQHLGRTSGQVRVSCRDGGQAWVFEVEDDGVGIEPQHLERVFKIFQRLKPDAPGSGTGLGLSLVKKMVEQQGGKVTLRSIPGAGSVFGFTIPKRDRPRQDAAPNDAPGERRRDDGEGPAAPGPGGNPRAEARESGDAHLPH